MAAGNLAAVKEQERGRGHSWRRVTGGPPVRDCVPGWAGCAVPSDDQRGDTALAGRPSLSQAIDALGRLGVAAIAVRGRLDPNELPIATRLTQRWSCVLLQLPDNKEGAVSLVEAKVT